MSIKHVIFFILALCLNNVKASECNTDLDSDFESPTNNLNLSEIVRYDNETCSAYKGCMDTKKIFKTSDNNNELISNLQNSAKSDNIFSQVALGLLYFEGKYAQKSLDMAEKYWLTAAEKFYPRAHYALGVLYHEQGKNEDSAKHFKISADLGYEDALLITALNYYHGRYGLEQDEDKFFIAAGESLGSELMQHVSLKWPDPCQEIPPLKFDIPRIIELMTGNEGWYSDGERQKRIRQMLLAYDENQFKNTLESSYYDYDASGEIPSMSTSVAIRASAAMKSLLGTQGFLKNLSDQPENKNGDTLESMNGAFDHENAYIIYSKRFKPSESEGSVSLDEDEFWNTVAPSDWLLLTDKITHHWSQIFKIDRKNDLIYISDSWPKESFLLANNNEEDISAEFIDYEYGRQLLKITKDDFLKVSVGVNAHRAFIRKN